MQMTELAIHQAMLLDLKQFDDARGSFCEAYRASWLARESQRVQWNVSRSKAGVVRGLHLHRRQTDYWHLVSGEATAALVDVRPNSPTRGKAICVELTAAKPQSLLIPTGILHGFHARTDVVLMYLLDQEYDPADELGVRWNDPALGLPANWYEFPSPVLSPRDAAGCLLKDLRL